MNLLNFSGQQSLKVTKKRGESYFLWHSFTSFQICLHSPVIVYLIEFKHTKSATKINTTVGLRANWGMWFAFHFPHTNSLYRSGFTSWIYFWGHLKTRNKWFKVRKMLTTSSNMPLGSCEQQKKFLDIFKVIREKEDKLLGDGKFQLRTAER